MQLTGTWHITEMEMWNANYFNMEVQAYLEINAQGMGNFQFGLVSGQMDGKFVAGEDKRYEFIWEGNDECDPASGSGWLRLQDANTAVGEFDIDQGDRSEFTARRA